MQENPSKKSPLNPPPEDNWKKLYLRDFCQLQKKSLGQILLEKKLISQAQLEEALAAQSDQTLHGRERLGQILVSLGFVQEEEMLKALAYQLDLPYYDKLPINDIDASLVENIPIQFCKDHSLLPLSKDHFNVTVATADPLDLAALDDLRLMLSSNTALILSPRKILEEAINRVYERSHDGSQKVIDELNVPGLGAAGDLEEARDLLESSDDEKPIIRLVNGLLSRAVKERASDIHVEPYENEVVVRFRIDGSLHDTMKVPKRHLGSLVSRIKIIGKLNIAEKRVPQDGRIGIKVAGKDIDVRLSVLPTAHGERVVMRLLDKSSGVKNLEEGGLNEKDFENWSKLIKQKHGIILVTGPTGSGKTSLLYASILQIHTVDVNILTIEDPVEYRLPGIGQIDVKTKIGLTFGQGLRAILRQDPDIIMIGEIRDEETASIAVQSSLTGHLVFSTLHTNDTAATITRLADLGVQPFQIASALLGVMATRLIRRLCPHCKVAHKLTAQERKLLDLKAEEVADKKIYKAGAGCGSCYQQGYKDRLAIHELMLMDDKLKSLIIRTQDSNAIRKAALDAGMKVLRQSAIEKVLQGLTSMEEALQKTQTED